MPLTEFLRVSKGKVDATQLKGFTSDDTSCRPDSDCVELVWENGQITMQGQSSKATTRRVPNSRIFPTTVIPKAQDNSRVGNVSKISNKLSTMDSMLGDFSLPVPSYEVGGLDQDVEMAPWLSYTVEEDSLHNEYTSDFLRELSGVTINDLPAENHLASREMKSGFFNSSVVDSMENVKHGNSSKFFSSVEKHSTGESSEVPQFSLPFHNHFSRSGISGVMGNTTRKLDGGQTSTSSGITNFPYFSRPGFIPRANHPTASDSNRLESGGKGCTLSSGSAHVNSSLVDFSSGCTQKDIVSHNQSLLGPVNGHLESLPPMPREELRSSNQASVCGEDVNVMNNASQDQARGMVVTKPVVTEERNKEPVGVATSSVCSGNSVERASNEYARDLKRKSRETTESDGPSDEADEESIGARRKAGPHRSGAKRGRAAEVHNQSERRRRDRINEKMRVLQELIPNCNKVDKVSMLDEAIEYLKTLQLQVQMMSMSTGMYMHPMMVPPGMQPMHGAQMPQFSPMGVGMGMGMGFGMNMLDVNTGMKMMPFQGAQYPVPGPQYPVPGTGPTLHVMGGSNLNPFGHPNQGVPMPVQRPHTPILLVSGIPPLKVPMVTNVSGVAGATNAVLLCASSNPTDAPSQSVSSNHAKSSVNPATTQVMNEGLENPRQSHDQAQTGNNATDTASVTTSRTNNMPS